MRALPSCSCGRPMMPVIEGCMMMPGWAQGAGRLCVWCDQYTIPYTESLMMWSELEMLERGSWPARIQGLIDDHQPRPNCRCFVFPQVEPPENQ